MRALSFLSSVAAPIEIFSSTGNYLGRATSFFYSRDEKWSYLVTNWHIVTGRHPASPRISETGAIPIRFRLTLHRRVSEKHISLSQKVILDGELNDETGAAPKWLEHPSHKFKVDVIVLKIPNDDKFRSEIRCGYLSEYSSFQEDYHAQAMDDVFVIGYPWGLTGGDPVLPVYKRGSVASEPLVDFGKLPRFLIDCRTAKGMSGSPVICSHSGIWSRNGKLENDSIIGTVQNFAGVYSGRLRPKETGENDDRLDQVTEIGVIWKKSVVEEIVRHGVAGTMLSEI